MPGSPKKRAKRETEDAKDAPELTAPPEQTTTRVTSGVRAPLPPMAREEPQADARPRAPAQARPRAAPGRPRPEPAPAMQPISRATTPAGATTDAGPTVRSRVDRHRAGVIDALQHELAPGVIVRIERTRPTWCMGYLEDWQLEEGTWGELLEYLRDEHGGQRYTISVLTPNGVPLLQISQPVSGRPRERGKLIDREIWEAGMRGESAPRAVAAAAAANPWADPPRWLIELLSAKRGNDDSGAGQMDMFRLIMEESRHSRDATLETVARAVQSQGETHSQLVAAIAKNAEGASLGEQLGTLRDSMRQVKEIEDDLRPEPEVMDEGLGAKSESMGNELVKSFMMAKMGGAPPMPPGMGGAPGAPGPMPGPPRYPRRDQAQPRPATDAPANVIPFAREVEG